MGGLRPALLALEDGTVFRGFAYGAAGTACAEVVFHTSMAGYTEILTDPSYRGQFVTFSYPLIGNYGVSPDDHESDRFQAEGVVVREATTSGGVAPELEPLLAERGVVGIRGVDTRALVRRLREAGVLKGCIDSTGLAASELVDRARAHPEVTGGDFVDRVSAPAAYDFEDPVPPGPAPAGPGGVSASFVPRPVPAPLAGAAPRVAVVDCGVKRSILRQLAERGARVRVYPARVARAELLAWRPDGVVFSNGPGDPVDVPHVVDLAASLIGTLPVLGICLGHQVLARALGMETYKLRYGHHGGNHPVGEIATGRVAITSQNHNYCVRWDEARARDWEPTLRNLNDGTLEGFRHRSLPVTAIQFHPEAGPGPHDARPAFDDFARTLAPARAAGTGTM
ncbi:MAG: glutamine-hydrolyzing carbamoyl-phosphate synthase small subunit [Candidatus Eisenbacteria bacterium]|nr:glutamine-hydrolyzing carbamoyl-phosphate synthase small subunit [Candidatus Eisenbacteria bacterium]